MSRIVWKEAMRTFDRKTWLGMAGCVLVICAVVPAQTLDPVVRVEEDWELVLNAPNGDLLAPQLHTVLSPFADLDTCYAQISWNYREVPDFAPGGFQVQAWANDTVVAARSFDLVEFSRQSERFTWTQVMVAYDGWAAFAVIDGYSPTWGAFGGVEAVVADFTGLPNLEGYSTDVSVKNSLITYGANRVRSLGIVQVRYYGASGQLLYRDAVPRVVNGGQ